MIRMIFDDIDPFLLSDEEKEFYNQIWEQTKPKLNTKIKVPYVFLETPTA